MTNHYYCLHGYARGVCVVCVDPEHKCRVRKIPAARGKVRDLRAQNAELLEALKELAEAYEDVENPTRQDRAYSAARALIASIKEEQK
ncbi:MAG TPA: hypothetical protein VJA25_02110 [Dehalococcoidia bacterium]|nr:hypothetical protein [Dehalococcoidia bacterium]